MTNSDKLNIDSSESKHLAFGNDMSRIVRGIAVVLMVTGHSLPGKIIPFAVPLFSFLVGYGYFFARTRTLRHAATRIWHLLSHFWLILFGICLPAALISWTEPIKTQEVLLNMVGLCGRFNFYCWYIYFYIAAMLLMPVVSRGIDRFGFKATIGFSLFFGAIAGSIFQWGGSWLTTGSPNVVSVIYRVCRYMPIVVVGYWLAKEKIFSRIPLRRSIYTAVGAMVLLAAVYLFRGLPYVTLLDLLWTPVAAAALAVPFNLYALPLLRLLLTELGLKSMGIWFLHALFFTHATRNLFLPLVSWIPLDNGLPQLLWLPRGSLRIPVVVILSFLMAWAVDLLYKWIKSGCSRLSARFALPSLIVVVAAAATSCSSEKENGQESYGNIVYKPEYASAFNIRSKDGAESIVVESLNPWQGADGVAEYLFVSRGGEKAPEGWSGQAIAGNPMRIVTTSSTHIAFIEALGEADRIVGVSGKPFISSQAIARKGDSVADIGYDDNVDYEKLVALRPDLVMLYGVKGESAMERKLRELHIPFVYIGDYIENSPLGKAEWIVAIGEILGKGEEARSIFAEIPKRYDKLAAEVKASGLPAPKVIINSPGPDSWLMPSTESYVAALVKDAGGEYVYSRNTGNASRNIDLEEALALAMKADIWIDTGMISNLDELKRNCRKFAGIKPMVSGRVYNNNRRSTPGGGNDYYESGVVRPDVVLADLIAIFHPGLVSGGELYYYQKLQ